MGRPAQLYSLRQRKDTGYWFFKLAGWKNYKTTGTTVKARALERVQKELKKAEKAAAAGPAGTLWAYLARYFVWETCPHVARLLAERKQISRRYVANRRAVMEKWIEADPGAIGDRPLAELRRRDLLDLRERVLAASSPSTANQVMGILKVCFKEGLYREDFDRNPASGIGLVGYERARRGVFSAAELERLFPATGPGPWKSERELVCFLLVASCGLRRGEVLALRVSDVHLAERRLRVERAWKDHHEEGDPKWGSRRTTPFCWQPDRVKRRLKAYMLAAKRLQPEELLFANTDGSRLGETWWKKAWERAMRKVAAELAEKKVLSDWRARRLSPHSLRHTLNTMLRDAGKDPAKIRAALGWTQEKTQDGYTHWGPEHLEDLRLG